MGLEALSRSLYSIYRLNVIVHSARRGDDEITVRVKLDAITGKTDYHNLQAWQYGGITYVDSDGTIKRKKSLLNYASP